MKEVNAILLSMYLFYLSICVYIHLIPIVHVVEEAEKLEDEHRELKIKYFELKQEHDELTDKMKFFTKVKHLNH